MLQPGMRIRASAFYTGLMVAGLLGGFEVGGASARPNLDTGGLSRLARYDVLSFTDPGGGGIDKSKAIGVFDATPDEVYRTATDYAKLAEFAPRVVGSRIVEQRGESQAFVMLSSDLPWPVSNAWVFAEFHTEKLGNDAYRIRFWQVKGSMRRYSGSILIEPWAPNKSAVTYELLAEPTGIAPKRLVNSKLKDAAARYVHALRQRINDLHRLGRLHPLVAPAEVPSTLAGSPQPNVVEHVATRR